MKILSDYSLDELYNILADYKKFRAKQIFDSIIQGKDYNETNLPKSMIDNLKSEYILKPIEIFKVLIIYNFYFPSILIFFLVLFLLLPL